MFSRDSTADDAPMTSGPIFPSSPSVGRERKQTNAGLITFPGLGGGDGRPMRTQSLASTGRREQKAAPISDLDKEVSSLRRRRMRRRESTMDDGGGDSPHPYCTPSLPLPTPVSTGGSESLLSLSLSVFSSKHFSSPSAQTVLERFQFFCRHDRSRLPPSLFLSSFRRRGEGKVRLSKNPPRPPPTRWRGAAGEKEEVEF